MSEKIKENNIEMKYPENNNINLKEKLIIDKNDNQKEETAFTENIEEENYTTKNDIKNNNKIIQNDLKEFSQNKNNNNTQIILDSIDDINKNDITSTSILAFRNSNINRESFQRIIEINNKEINKKIEENNTRLKIILFVIEIFLGILLSISSIVILFILYKDSFINQKLISLLIEPIILFISIIGIIPNKGRGCKKIVISLYLWEGLFLFPFSFYIKSSVEDLHLKNILNKILILRICLLSIQLVNFLLSLLLNINI